jgi:hypothetical protein
MFLPLRWLGFLRHWQIQRWLEYACDYHPAITAAKRAPRGAELSFVKQNPQKKSQQKNAQKHCLGK